MSRPSTEIIEKYNIIDQFIRYTNLCFKVFQQLPDTRGDDNNEVFMSLFVHVCLCQGMVLKQ